MSMEQVLTVTVASSTSVFHHHYAAVARCVLIAIAIQLVGSLQFCRGDEVDMSLSADHDRDGVNFVIKGVINRIESLQQGEAVVRFFTAADQTSNDAPSDWVAGSVYRHAFNYLHNQVFFEHTVPVDGGTRTLKLLMTDESRISYEEPRSGPGSVTIYPVSWMTEVPEAIPVDFRIAGIVGWGEICTSATFDDCKSKYWLNPGMYQKVSLERDKTTGLVKLLMIHTDKSGAEAPLLITVDEKKQYAPVEVRRFFRPPPDAEHPDNSRLIVIDTISTTWKENSGVWVPETWSMERGLQAPVKFEFDWKAVNSLPNERTFDMSGMDLPKGTHIFNRLGKEPVAEGVIGESAPLFDKPAPRQTKRFSLLLILNVFFAGTASLIYLWRKQRPA